MLSTGGKFSITAEEVSISRPQPEIGEKNAGDYLKQVKASRPLVDDPRMTSDGRADRCAVLGEHIRCLLRESSVFAAFV